MSEQSSIANPALNKAISFLDETNAAYEKASDKLFIYFAFGMLGTIAGGLTTALSETKTFEGAGLLFAIISLTTGVTMAVKSANKRNKISEENKNEILIAQASITNEVFAGNVMVESINKTSDQEWLIRDASPPINTPPGFVRLKAHRLLPGSMLDTLATVTRVRQTLAPNTRMAADL